MLPFLFAEFIDTLPEYCFLSSSRKFWSSTKIFPHKVRFNSGQHALHIPKITISKRSFLPTFESLKFRNLLTHQACVHF